MSRRAVSAELFVSVAHFDVVSAPSGLVPHLQTQGLHLASQSSLQVPGGRERGEVPVVPPERRPVWQVVDRDRGAHSPQLVR